MVEKGFSVQEWKLEDLMRPRLGTCTETFLPNSVIRSNYRFGTGSGAGGE